MLRRKFSILLVASGLILGSCCDEDFIVPDYDFFEYALDVSALMNECSPDEAYTTVGASADKSAGECWFNTGPLYNRWFKFTAPATGDVSIEVQIQNGGGTQLRTYLVLWDTDGTTELDCSTYGDDDANVYMYNGNLTVGATYYFSVDVADADGQGTFGLCLWDTD